MAGSLGETGEGAIALRRLSRVARKGWEPGTAWLR
jgi:hypothetical protein